MTEASRIALIGLRDFTTIKWYAIPLLSVVLYIYAKEIHKSRLNGNWDPVFAGLTLFGVDFFNETWNGWVLNISGRSAVWTAPGDTALRVMVGWNLEIIFMFLIAGIVYYYTLSTDSKEKILDVNNRWFWAIAYSAFCVFVEVILNKGGHLVWEYAFWGRSFKGIWLIFLFGYFHFFAAIILVLNIKKYKTRICIVSGIYGLAVLMNIIGASLGWRY